ncbi:hypothetical protein BGZ98_004442 [Dissophora globulifera]|nr:hypothetical protein BGZ98_004442 [Dissophora globulifera]
MSTTLNTTVKSDIYLCHFYAEPMSLLGAMGRMKDTAPFLGQQGSMLAQDAYTATTTSLLTPSDVGGVVKAKDAMVDSADLEKQLTTAQAAEKKALESLNSESKTSTAPAFEAVFFDHVQQQSAEAMEDIIMSHGLDPQEVKVALAADQERKDAAHKLKQQQAEATQDMDIDAEPTANGSKSSRKEMKKAAKAARKAAKEGETEEEKKDKKERKEAKAERKAARAEKKAVKAVKTGDATKVAEDAESGSSSESSSDDEDDDDEMVVMSSEDERNDDDQDEEPEYEVDEEQERVRREAYLHDVEEWRKMETEAIKKYQHQRRLLRAGRKPAPLPELSHHFLTTVLARCFRRLPNGQPDMTFWPGKVVEYLIENQLVGNSNPGAGQAGIALELMEREQWPLLELALRKLHDIPELDMMTMLKQVIGLNKNKDSSEKTATAASLSPVPEVAHFLNLVMTVPRNEIFMQQAVKKLTVEELSLVLEILKGWISIWDERGGIGHQNQQPDKRQLPGGLPGYGLMVDFITILMDVHFPSLILSPHLHPILKTIQSSIERETEISNQLEQALRGPLSLFNRKHRETEQRKKMAAAGGAVVSSNGVVSATGGLVADKRRRRKWEGGEGVPDYAVEIIHL